VESDRRLKIAVLGSASVPEDSPEGRKAFSLGQGIAEREGVILTGGCPGLPHAAVQGALSAGGHAVAVSPAMNRAEHREKYGYPLDSRIILFTGMGTKGRNVILVRSADACIFVGGGMGTLNEFTIAFDELGSDCAIGVFLGTGGLAGELSRVAQAVGRSSRALFEEESNLERLLDKVFLHLRR
jgi:uncharacterized protein (TIGR00725 family)